MNKTMRYLIWTFAIAWALQGGAIYFFWNGNGLFYTVLLSASMFAPLVGALLSKHPLKALGWKPHLKGKLRFYLLAWYGPAIVSVIGAALFFLVFPGTFDPEAGMLEQTIGAAAMAQLAEQGMTPSIYLMVSAISAITYAPLVNMLTAIGEEIGWRGVLSPALREKFGRIKASLLMGLIWGVWHWPVIILVGYEYGSVYVGAPVLGPLVFLVFTFSLGVLLDWLYEKTGCIWVPALAHGAINAFGSAPLYCLAVEKIQMRIFGPVPVGLIAGLPFVIASVAVLWYDKTNPKPNVKAEEPIQD